MLLSFYPENPNSDNFILQQTISPPIIILKYYIYGSIVKYAQPYENTHKINPIYFRHALHSSRACPNKLYTQWEL
jgi:hypothetical protein